METPGNMNAANNPYAPPRARVDDHAGEKSSHSIASDAATPFFAVSLTKLVVLSLCSSGLYEMYWFYKNWQRIREREQSDIWPFARAFFGILFCYSCFKRMRAHSLELSVRPPFAAGALAVGWIVTTISWKLPAPYWWITQFAVAFLVPVQAHANDVNQAVAAGHDRNDRFSRWNWVLIVAGGGFLILSLIGEFLPER